MIAALTNLKAVVTHWYVNLNILKGFAPVLDLLARCKIEDMYSTIIVIIV